MNNFGKNLHDKEGRKEGYFEYYYENGNIIIFIIITEH